MIRPHLRYLWYVAKHKYGVFRAGRWTGAPIWNLIVHDHTKFRPSEWRPYVDHFYSDGRSRESAGYYHRPEAAKSAFNYAWLAHLRSNPHHWQYWILQTDHEGVLVMEMPERFVREMVADWCGASYAQGFGFNIFPWYEKHKCSMVFHENTKRLVDKILRELSI